MIRPVSDLCVLVTGAGRGLGAAIARAFAREGATVALNYRRSQAAAEAVAAELGPRAAAVAADVTDAAQVQRMICDIAELGRRSVDVERANRSHRDLAPPVFRDGGRPDRTD